MNQTQDVPLSDRAILLITTIAGLATWTLHSIFWWAHLEGDAPLYPFLSVRVLEGQHFLMTEGQAHGGTLLIYLRAALFKIFGVSHFIGFFVNGIFATAGAVLWSRFALKYSGKTAALVMGLLGAVATERFARSACTDYFVFTLFSSGLMLCFAEAMARKPQITRRDALAAGLLIGFSWYICRFSAMYLVAAFVFFLAMVPEARRFYWVPRASELWNGLANKALVTVTAIGLGLSAIAFFANDQFLGINAESNLKIFIVVGALTWLKLRFRQALGALSHGALLLVGALITLSPEIAFKRIVAVKDRSTGLVRWRDLEPLVKEIPVRIGENFAFYHPSSWGIVAAVCGFALVALLCGKRRYFPVVLPVVMTLAAWLCIHTYMHLPTQYFFPVFFPLYLAAGIAVAESRFRKTAIALTAVVFAVGLIDNLTNAVTPNVIARSQVIEKIEETKAKWNISHDSGFGMMPSNYNIMWAAKGKYFFPKTRDDERFQAEQKLVWDLPRVLYVHHEKDRHPPTLPSGYEVLEELRLNDGFRLWALEKSATGP